MTIYEVIKKAHRHRKKALQRKRPKRTLCF